MQRDAYLNRIGYTGACAPTTETLRALHRAHMLAVSFENLDIPSGIPIVLSLPSLYPRSSSAGAAGFAMNSIAGQREEREVGSEEEYRALLLTQFGMELGAEVRIDKLMVQLAWP